MSVVLASAWHPRGELPRFLSLLPALQAVYAGLVLSLPADLAPEVEPALEKIPWLRYRVMPVWASGRYTVLKMAAAWEADFVQYADFDRLLRWVETRPGEWRQTVETLPRHDCLVIGRTPAAYATHPRALVETEAISNRVASALLGQEMDVSAGSRGFSRAAAVYLAQHSRPDRPMGADAEWPILLQRAGFAVDYLAVDGLDWESADQYQDRAAHAEAQRQAAAEYDAAPQHWRRRVEVANEIVASALAAAGYTHQQV